MDLDVFDYYNDIYPKMSNLLLNFLEDTYYPERNDGHTICRSIEEWSVEYIAQTIKEGRAVLALDPFPWEWVSAVTNKLVYDSEKNKWVEDELLYKKWVTWMIESLEAGLQKKV